MKVKTITFKGEPYLYIRGALATPEQFQHGRRSFAHHFPEHNAVMQNGLTIGTNEDVVFTGETTVKIADDAFDNMFNWIEWL